MMTLLCMSNNFGFGVARLPNHTERLPMNLSFPALAAFGMALSLTTSLRADDAAIAAQLKKFPPPAAEALKKAAGSAKIEKLSIEKDGKVTVYEAVLTEPGQPNREVSVTA